MKRGWVRKLTQRIPSSTGSSAIVLQLMDTHEFSNLFSLRGSVRLRSRKKVPSKSTHIATMSILERIRQRAAAKPQHIVLPEGNDPRTGVAAAICARNRMARITLLGDEATIRETAQREGADLGGVEVIDHLRAPDFEKMAALFHEMRRAKGLMADEARTLLTDPLYYGNLMVRLGNADGSVAGATNTTSHTVRAALHCIGVRSGFKLVSSFFLMALPEGGSGFGRVGHNGALIFAD